MHLAYSFGIYKLIIRADLVVDLNVTTPPTHLKRQFMDRLTLPQHFTFTVHFQQHLNGLNLKIVKFLHAYALDSDCSGRILIARLYNSYLCGHIFQRSKYWSKSTDFKI